MSSSKNDIVERQNSARGLKILRARSEIYRQAENLQKAQLFLTVFVPFIGSVLGSFLPDARGYVALAALAITVLDVSFLDRGQRNELKLAAKISELLDTEVLQLPWNSFVAGSLPSPEQVTRAADAWPAGDGKLVDWYPTAIERAPLHLARAICQRTNLWYDAELRRRYSGILLGIILAMVGVLVIIGLVRQMTLVDFAATVVTPAAPMITWAMRDFYRQRDTAEAQTTARIEVERLWDLIVTDSCGPDECKTKARELQNTIFTRRASSPLVFPGVYNRLRPGMETQMNVAAAELLQQAGVR